MPLKFLEYLIFATCVSLAKSADLADTNSVDVPVLPLVLLLLGAVLVLLALILLLKLQAFLALLLTSVLTSVGAVFINPSAAGITEIGEIIVSGMGNSLGFVATIIGIGAIFGAMLENSGGTQSLARASLRVFGAERASWAMLLTGFIISIPVFLDVGLVILTPLLKALAKDTNRSLLFFGLPLAAGMATTHAFVPPTPGPVAVAYFLGVNLGYVILFGLLIGFPTAVICGPLLCGRLVAQIESSPKTRSVEEAQVAEHAVESQATEPRHSHADLEVSAELEEGNADAASTAPHPSAMSIIGLIALPIVLILGNTLVEQVATSGISPGLTSTARKQAVSEALDKLPIWAQAVHLIGHPVVALLLCTLLTVWFLGSRRGLTGDELNELSTKALGPAGIIILITGAGGVFKQVLGASGITQALTAVFANVQIPLVAIAWIFATLIRVAQGSATVAMLTAAGLMTGFVKNAQPSVSDMHLALLACAIASGATGFSHVNDSGFWMISRYFGLTERQTLKTWTVVSTAISVVSFVFILILNALI